MSHRISNITRTPGGQVFGDLPAGELEELGARVTEVARLPELERSLRRFGLERAST